jgi:hypothetical protein
VFIVLFRNDIESNKLPEIAGCFISQDHGSKIDITSNGQLNFQNGSVKIKILRDKLGLSIVAARALYRDDNGNIFTSDKTPLKMRIKNNFSVITFANDEEVIDFIRIPCQFTMKLR